MRVKIKRTAVAWYKMSHSKPCASNVQYNVIYNFMCSYYSLSLKQAKRTDACMVYQVSVNILIASEAYRFFLNIN